MGPEARTCRNCSASFAVEADDFAFYEKMAVSPPTLCPPCRLQRRMAFRNEHSWYRRTCDLCRKSIVAMYPADAPYTVYCVKCWWSDNWDPYQYGREFDFSRPFFEQFRELYHQVPMLAMQNDNGVASFNSEYANDFAFSKNCYMTATGWYSENVMYSYYTCYDKDVADCWRVNKSELMYEVFHTERSYGCAYSEYLYDCRNCLFSYDLKDCSDCFMCNGLRGKSYCIRNQQYSREEYFKKLYEAGWGDRRALGSLREEFRAMSVRFPRKYASILKSVHSTGNGLINCKQAKDCFYANDIEDSRFIVLVDGISSSYDCVVTGKATLCYDSVTPDHSYRAAATIFCWECTEARYSNNCHGSENILGCSALRKGSYCILNRRYSKEEYAVLYEKIVAHMRETGEWGEFFPASLSPFAYNEAQCQDWFPMKQEQALAAGYRWRLPEEKTYEITLQPEGLPPTIAETDDAILKEVIACAHRGACDQKCSTAFRIASQELQLCRKLGIPVPQLCPNCRHYERLRRIDPIALVQRKCMCEGEISQGGTYKNTREHSHAGGECLNEFQTIYGPERPEIVYCEGCYNAEVA